MAKMSYKKMKSKDIRDYASGVCLSLHGKDALNEKGALKDDGSVNFSELAGKVVFGLSKKVIRDHLFADEKNNFTNSYFCDAHSVITFIEDVFLSLGLYPYQRRADNEHGDFVKTEIKDGAGNVLVHDARRLSYLDPQVILERKINKSNVQHFRDSVETVAKRRAYYCICGVHPVKDDNDGNFSAVEVSNNKVSKNDYRNR